MSPDRRVSWPTTIAPPGGTRRRTVARPRAYARVGRRSTLATPRMPSVPKRRVIDQVGLGVGMTVTVTATEPGAMPRSVVPAGRVKTTVTSWVPGPRFVTSSVARRLVPSMAASVGRLPPRVTRTDVEASW